VRNTGYGRGSGLLDYFLSECRETWSPHETVPLDFPQSTIGILDPMSCSVENVAYPSMQFNVTCHDLGLPDRAVGSNLRA